MGDELGAAVRRAVASRAGGCCEYCLISEDYAAFRHEIDHVISLKHLGASELDNLAYCCMVCNRHKGSDIGSRNRFGQLVRLFNPRREKWSFHFLLAGPVIEPLTEIAEVTARLLKLNASQRVEERRLLQLLGRYPRQSP